MMGIVVPETCWAYNKYNKTVSSIYLVLILQLSQWCTVQHTSNYIFWVCSLRYPKCNAYAPYRDLWPFRPNKISPHYLINGTITEKGFLNMKYVFCFSLQLLSKTFLILRGSERDMNIDEFWSSCKYALFLSDCNFLGRLSKKLNFMKIPSVGAELFYANW